MSRKPNTSLAIVLLSAAPAWLTVAMLVGVCVSHTSPGQCPSVWNAPEFVAGCPAVAGITALAQFDDGTGPALYAGVSQSGSSIARWDGAKWTDVGGGTNGPVKALVVFDDGHGPALYVGGSFTMAGTTPTPSGIARWDGNSWSPLPAGAPSPTCLAVWDDGTGPAIYAAGSFTVGAGAAGNSIAKFNGTSWSPLGSGLTGTSSPIASGATCMMACNGSPGPGLYVGGYFTTAGATAVNGIARWNGTSWSALGSGVTGPSLTNLVQALALYDSGSGLALYAGGGFTSAGGVAANRIARWNGTSWSALGAGVNGKVTGLFTHDDGTGPQLWIGGAFTIAGTTPAASIARWNGTAYSAVGAGFSLGFLETSVGPMIVFNPGSGPRLVVGGRFAQDGTTTVNNVAQWVGGTWVPLSSSPSGVVRSAVVYDDGSGPALYVGGDFTFAGVVAASHVAKWNGSTWAALGTGVNGNVNAMAVFGGSLYVGGSFTTAGGLPANYVARWDGAGWSALGTGIAPVAGGTVNALIVFDSGTGPALHAGGVFVNAGGNAVINVARWSGTAWSAAGDGLNGPIDAFAAFDDGAGVKLHAGGLFATTGGGLTVNNVAKLSGATWAALGSGTAGEVYALGVYGAGSGLLYAGGAFTSAGGNGALAQLARWNGSAWSSAGASPGAAVRALAPVTDVAGTFLYAGGDFTAIGGITASHVARYDGTSWSAMNQGTAAAPAGPGAAPLAFAPFTVGGSTLVHAVGQFGKADGASSFYIGRFGPYPPSIGHGPAPATMCAGAAATLSVTASGAPPLTYQWRRNAVAIPGATSSSYSIPSTATAHAGAYSVEVTNGCGSATSANAVLTVNAPSITTQPAGAAVCEGAAASFSVVASGVAPLAYQWRKNAVNIGGATSSSYSIASTMAADAAAYSVVVTDGCGSVTSADALLTVNTEPSITAQPAGATVCEGASASFSVAVSGGGSFTYQWRKDAVDIPGATSSSYSIASTVAGDAATYSVEATNDCGSVTSANAVLTVNTLSIMSQPSGATVCEGAAASFSVVAAGMRPLTYQWRKNAANILGATASSYSIASTVAGDSAAYDVVVTNGCGSATSSAAVLTVNVPVSFTAEPQSQAACPGSAATFEVAVSGTAPFSYQWQKDGMPIGGAMSSSYVVASVSAADVGAYSVVVSNACGSATSAAAVLTLAVTDSIMITVQPLGATVCEGSGTVFSVTASGTGPLAYQWRWNGATIAGATSSIYAIGAATPAIAGAYDVIVSASCVSVISDPAILTVVPSTPGVTCSSVVAVGTGCGGAGMPGFACSGPQIGQNVTFWLTQATPNAAGAVFYSGIPPATIPLGWGCTVALDLATFAELFPVVADSTGAWGLAFFLPVDPNLVGVQVGLQIALFPTAGPLGLDLSNGLYVTIGS